MNDLKFACPHCNQHMEAPPEMFGTIVACPSCNKQIQVPQPAPVASAPPPLTEETQQPMNTSLAPRTNGLAITSLVFGIIGLLTGLGGLLFGIPAVVCGHVSRSKIKKSLGTVSGRRTAVAGLVTGYIAIVFGVGFLSSVLIPMIQRGRLDGQMPSIQSKGKLIYIAILDYAAFEPRWPGSNVFPTSTSAFTNLIANSDFTDTSRLTNMFTKNVIDDLKEGYSIFAAPGMKPYRGKDGALFKAENNAWCFVECPIGGLYQGGIPIIFTRNLRVNNLRELTGRVGDNLSTNAPFGRAGAILINEYGVSIILKPDMLWKDVFHGATFTNRVLRP